ncbi:MAG TPA: FxLYD domain-containing protein [Verrucomicrobiae bacterium]|nr:FxLYD domain-containing protein [Verrucomicrobiae bacterium]
MGEIVHAKCACKECGNHIEFPAYAARTTVPCPHCGQWTELIPPEAEPEPKRVDFTMITLIACAVLVIIGAIWWHHRPKPVVDENAPPQVTRITPVPIPAKSPPAVTAPIVPPVNVVTQAVVQAPVKPTRPKSPDDLKAGAVELQKTPGSSLIYAIGAVKNDSDYQRFGVKIELELLNKKGEKIGDTQDYKDIIEPRQEWQFHALVPDKRTASAKITSLKEQE